MISLTLGRNMKVKSFNSVNPSISIAAMERTVGRV